MEDLERPIFFFLMFCLLGLKNIERGKTKGRQREGRREEKRG